MKVMYAAESDYKLKQLAKQFGWEKRVVVKYHDDFKYIQIYDNRKEAKTPGITLGYDEFRELSNIIKFMDIFFKDKSKYKLIVIMKLFQ